MIAAFLMGLFAAAQAPAPPPVALKPGAPKLVVVISIDQLSSDLFEEYRPQFTGQYTDLWELKEHIRPGESGLDIHRG